ncbi:Hypothetical predicted protein [Paramuricea clavata]|uniref:Uncharacterized protein n=1 Tax=Paramuricea clavata TaxID=317549 RepID=A0A7D9IJT6_PARCT|nr:Hypothetical predicted protein [Paramuricea clavata]
MESIQEQIKLTFCLKLDQAVEDNEKRRPQEAKQAEKINKRKRKDGARFQEEECIADKLRSEIRQGFPLKKRRRMSVDNAKDTLENISTQPSNEGNVSEMNDA